MKAWTGAIAAVIKLKTALNIIRSVSPRFSFALIDAIFFSSHGLSPPPKKKKSFVTSLSIPKYMYESKYFLSHNNPCFQCNIAITIFFSHTRVR